MSHPTVTLTINNQSIRAAAPAIISASRATDIPAYHAQWFVRQLQAGFTKKIAPYTNKDSHVSFENAGAIVFWTKNAAPMLPYLHEVDSRNLAYYFQYTVNAYDPEGLEPNVPPLDQRIETFIKLSEQIGAERVLWRFDPIILGGALTVKEILRRFSYISERIHTATRKVIFSFVDIRQYKKVPKALQVRNLLHLRAPTQKEEHQLASEMARIALNYNLTIASCAEPQNFSAYGIEKNRCIDDVLLAQICQPNHRKLQRFLSSYAPQHTLFSSEDKSVVPRDKSQRPECECVICRDIGKYNSCHHNCVYCYANVPDSLFRFSMT